MKQVMRFIYFAIAFCQMATAQQNVRTIFLVRHAEKAIATPDAALSPAGEKRAECLAQTFKDSGIKQIFVSDVKATQQTAGPLGKALNIKPSIIVAHDNSSLARSVLYGSRGNTLVVGDRDTLPVMIARLQGGSAKPVGENEYDQVFILPVIEGGGTPATSLRYCASLVSSAPVRQTSRSSARQKNQR
jgi:hypothetical protein